MKSNHKCSNCGNETFAIKMFDDKPVDWLICGKCGHIHIVDYRPMEKTDSRPITDETKKGEIK